MIWNLSHRMIRKKDIATLHQALVDRLKNLGMIRTPRVEEAFRAVPRHLFVPDVELETAYSDAHIVTRWQDGLPISSCSQPTVTAIMLEMLTQHLKEQITAWEQAGRPFVWSARGTMEHLRIRAYPLEPAYILQAYETLLTRRWTQFVFIPLLHDQAQPLDTAPDIS